MAVSAEQFAQRDLWWEARQKAQQQNALTRSFNPVVTKMMSFAGQPTRAVMAALALGRDKSKVCLAIDLNKYREPQVKRIKEYRDAGVDLFIGRMGGPSRWVFDDWAYAEDKTWRMMLEECAKIGIEPKDTVGYGVQNPFLGEQANYEDHFFADYLDLWGQGGADPGAYFADHEVRTCWKGGKETPCTDVNMVRSLANDITKVREKFRNKLCGFYTGRWFIDQVGLTNYAIFIRNANNGAMRVPLWMAWLPQNFAQQFTNLEDILDLLIIPSTEQKKKYLMVDETEALLWQHTFTLKLPGDTVGVDASVSFLPKEAVLAALNMAPTPPQEEPEQPEEPEKPEEPQPVPDLTELLALARETNAMERETNALVKKTANHFV